MDKRNFDDEIENAFGPEDPVNYKFHNKNNNIKQKKHPKSNQTFLGRSLYLILIIIVSGLVSYYAITRGNDMLGLIKPSNDVTVTINSGASLDDTAKLLYDEGVIKYKSFFKLYVRLSGSGDDIKAGTFMLNTDMPYNLILSQLKKSPKTSPDTVVVTIPEGYELRQIVDLLVDKGVCKREEIMDKIQNYDFKYDFLKDVPKRENRLEGYLFPDTYEFYKNENPIPVLTKMLDNFASKYDGGYVEEGKKLGLTSDQIIILASIIEREAANNSERGKISAVFNNRLKSKEYPYLQSCATVQYILKDRKAVLSTADTEIDNKYNTYKYKGLPPGPIASPGLESIKAAVEPDNVDYLFFVANPGSSSLFASTYEEHLKNVSKVKK